MSGPAERTRTALAPLRRTLLTHAEAEARARAGSAEAEGRELLEAARRQRDSLLQEARTRGEADGALRLSAERARVQRGARRVVLAAQRSAYDDLRRQAVNAVRELFEEPAERARLTAVLRRRLGAEAVVGDHPAGGLVGEARDGRVVDASVDALVDLALTNLDLESLWTRA
jgi:vacuolar-type H+-ATPase subunit E/Vma4